MLTLHPRRAVYFSMGSNLGDRRASLRTALSMLAARGIDIARVSPLYETAPMYVTDQPAFYNMAAACWTSAPPAETLKIAQETEKALGRDRTRETRNGPRTVDIDIVSMEGEPINTPELVLPHPRTAERRFVLRPLADVAGALVPAGWDCDVDAALARLPAADDDVRRAGPPLSPFADAPQRRDETYAILLRDFSATLPDGRTASINAKLQALHPGRIFRDDISAVLSYEDVVVGLRRLCAGGGGGGDAASMALSAGDLCLSFPGVVEAHVQIALRDQITPQGDICETFFYREV